MIDPTATGFTRYTRCTFACIVVHLLFSVLLGIYLGERAGCKTSESHSIGTCRRTDGPTGAGEELSIHTYPEGMNAWWEHCIKHTSESVCNADTNPKVSWPHESCASEAAGDCENEQSMPTTGCKWEGSDEPNYVLYECSHQRTVRTILGWFSLFSTLAASVTFLWLARQMPRADDRSDSRNWAIGIYSVWILILLISSGLSVGLPFNSVRDIFLRVVMVMHCLSMLVTYQTWRIISYSAQ